MTVGPVVVTMGEPSPKSHRNVVNNAPTLYAGVAVNVTRLPWPTDALTSTVTSSSSQSIARSPSCAAVAPLARPSRPKPIEIARWGSPCRSSSRLGSEDLLKETPLAPAAVQLPWRNSGFVVCCDAYVSVSGIGEYRSIALWLGPSVG